MAGRALASNDTPMAEINVTPLVDVMLVLLVIFIVMAPLFAQALRVDLPQAEAPPLAEPRILDVELMRSGELHVDHRPIDAAQLPERIRQALNETPEVVIRLGADQAVPYGRVARVIADLQQAGAEKLAFATQPGSAPPP
ncbi:MAG TPA: biopolymer transporter ExbD [Candidatus Macondimonas sp.]|nr:biopolymer transporter ExbD [Candidatus Macondimonas sp.]